MSSMVYNFPPEITYGWGESKQLGKLAASIGSKVLIVTDEGVAKAGLLTPLEIQLTESGVKYAVYRGIQPNPTDENVYNGVKLLREESCDVVVALGGGSPMDAAKGIILMTKHPGQLRDYYRGEENPRSITSNVPYFIAMPTTSGTGSEVSRGALITDTRDNRKRALSSKYLLPKNVILDPELTSRMPPKLTAHTGLDALSHLLEAYAVDSYSPIADALAKEGLQLISRSLLKAYRDGEDKTAREDMMMSSTMGALAFSKGLGVVHSLAHQLSTQIGIPHGAACGIIMPHAIMFNIEGANGEKTAKKYANFAEIFGVNSSILPPHQAGEEAAKLISRLLEELDVPCHLSEWGVKMSDIDIMAKNAMLDHCHPKNPRTCTEETMRKLFIRAM